MNGSIDHQAYLSSLENIKKEELTSVVFDFKQRKMEEEIFAFESQQMNEANQEISNREKNAETLLLQIEAEKTKQLEETRKLKEEEKKVQPQTFEEKLLKVRTDFYEQEAPVILDEYKKNARKHRSRHDRMQVAVIAGSALATSTTGATIFTGATNISITLKIIAALFSLMVTIASGSMAYFKYKERGNDTQKAADTIEDDYNALKLGTGIYRGKSAEESLSIFAENTNKTISEYKKKQQLLDQPPDAKSGQAAQEPYRV
jgi:hypothetical protein